MANQSAERRSVRVDLGDRSYPVLVGHGTVDGVEALRAVLCQARLAGLTCT